MRRNSPATELSDLPPAARPRERLRLIRHTRDPAAACTPRRGLHSTPPETMRTAATKMPVFTNPIELVRDRQAPCPGLRTQEPGRTSAAPADGPGLRSVSAPAACAAPSVLCARHAFFRNAAAARDAPKTGKGMPLSGHPFLLFCISTATGCAALPARQTEPPLRNPWASTVTFPEGNAPARYRYQRLATLMRAMARARASSARCTSVSGLGSDRRCSARALACSARSTSMSAASSAASASTVILLSAT